MDNRRGCFFFFFQDILVGDLVPLLIPFTHIWCGVWEELARFLPKHDSHRTDSSGQAFHLDQLQSLTPPHTQETGSKRQTRRTRSLVNRVNCSPEMFFNNWQCQILPLKPTHFKVHYRNLVWNIVRSSKNQNHLESVIPIILSDQTVPPFTFIEQKMSK